MAYSTVVTYLLWLTLGWLGVHHFYLRRDRHAFVWLWTLGGGCGLGWLAEVFSLPGYVRTANMEALHALGQGAFIAGGPGDQRLPLGVKRFIGMFVFAMWIGCLAMTAIPEEITGAYPWMLAIVSPAGVAIGVHTVANIGAEQCDLIVCFVAAYVMFPFFMMSSKDALPNQLTTTALLTSLTVSFNWVQSLANWMNGSWMRLSHLLHAFSSRSRRYRQTAPVRRSVCRRIVRFLGCSCAVWVLLLSALYFNTYISTDYGEQVKVRVALENFFSSPAWKQFRETGWKVFYLEWQRRASSDDFFKNFRRGIDPEGEQNAYRILDLAPSATEKEINDRHKELVRKFHPDKFVNVDVEEKKRIQERFIEIQQAYERISTIKAKRMRKSRRNEL